MLQTILSVLLSVYFVQFTDKAGSAPITFSERAIEQRARWGIATDSLDYAVSPAYLDSLREAGASIFHTTRWMNGATVEMDEATATRVAAFTFVQSIEMTRDASRPARIRKQQPRSSETAAAPTADSYLTDRQLALYNLTPLHEAGYEGQGILMTVCDGGFQNADRLDCFDAAHRLGTFDFTDDKDDFYGASGFHGTACLSTIAARNTYYYGSALQADYYLMRSEESATESPKEMDNLIAAFEKADSLGVNIFSASLGYAMFDRSDWNLTYADHDGRTLRASRAATIAARKGMLLCLAAGNEGDDPWYYLSCPSDADSVLTVGAVNADGRIAAFSSHGPAADGRVKPEVCAVGDDTYVILPATGDITLADGTSFATPLIAGMAASLWSALPEENAMQIRERIIRSARENTRYETVGTIPNAEYGYGIPDAWAAYSYEAAGLPATPSSAAQSARKQLIDGHLYILHGEELYDVLGRRIR